MSAATEFPPLVYIPSSASRTAERTATVLEFRPRAEPGWTPARRAPSLREAARAVPRTYELRRPAAEASGLQLTRRGYLVAVLLTAGLLAGALWLAHVSVAGAPPPSGAAPAVVTVHSGDTLWSIASRVAPQRDPRTVVAELERLNHVDGALLRPGQQLRTR
jgi:nucleoid-associated protein YgaU